MQSTQEAAMMDECYLRRWTAGTEDEYNLTSNATYPAAAQPTPCGLVFGNSKHTELMQATQAPMIATMIRLPLTTTLDPKDRIKVTKRFGVTETTPKTYQIIGHPKAGPSGLLVMVEIVTDGSDS
ncbi:MAG TPA: hypothetical protein VJL10_05075 [Anaerolineales bacterium]|nr:hypothetical protein [Anaerolineales bacterium]